MTTTKICGTQAPASRPPRAGGPGAATLACDTCKTVHPAPACTGPTRSVCITLPAWIVDAIDARSTGWGQRSRFIRDATAAALTEHHDAAVTHHGGA